MGRGADADGAAAAAAQLCHDAVHAVLITSPAARRKLREAAAAGVGAARVAGDILRLELDRAAAEARAAAWRRRRAKKAALTAWREATAVREVRGLTGVVDVLRDAVRGAGGGGARPSGGPFAEADAELAAHAAVVWDMPVAAFQAALAERGLETSALATLEGHLQPKSRVLDTFRRLRVGALRELLEQHRIAAEPLAAGVYALAACHQEEGRSLPGEARDSGGRTARQLAFDYSLAVAYSRHSDAAQQLRSALLAEEDDDDEAGDEDAGERGKGPGTERSGPPPSALAGRAAVAAWVSGLCLADFDRELKRHGGDPSGLRASQRALLNVAGHLSPEELHRELKQRKIDTGFLRDAFKSQLEAEGPEDSTTARQNHDAAGGHSVAAQRLTEPSVRRFTARQLRKVLEAHGLTGCATEVRDAERALRDAILEPDPDHSAQNRSVISDGPV